MLRNTNYLCFLSHSEYLKKKTDFLNTRGSTSATDIIKQTYTTLDALYLKGYHSKSFDMVKQKYHEYYWAGHGFININQNAYYNVYANDENGAPSKCGIIQKRYTDIEYEQKRKDFYEKHQVKNYAEFETKILEACRKCARLSKNHQALDIFCDRLTTYEKLHGDFLMQESPYDTKIVQLAKRQLRTKEQLDVALSTRSLNLDRNNPFGI